MRKILDGIKVLDFTQALAGVFCAMYMGDLGADVIKVERNHSGEQSREWGPFNNDFSGYFTAFNRNKRSIGIDLTSPRGKEIIMDLVKECDVVLENFKVGTLDRLGLGYEEMKKINPEIIYGSISGFGLEGPLSSYACYDIIACARSGILDRSGENGGAPIKAGFSLGDNWSGVNLLYGISMALLNKQATGKGCRLDVAMLDGAFYMMEMPVLENSVSGTVTPKNGNHDTRFAPSGVFRTSDGYVSIVCINNEQWANLCRSLELEDLINDELFNTNENRLANIGLLIEAIENRTTSYTKTQVEDMLTKNSVPSGAVMKIKEVMENQRMVERDMVVELDHKALGPVHAMGIPMKFSQTPGSVLYKQAPLVGEHTTEVLEEIGYTYGEIEALKREQIVCNNTYDQVEVV